MLKKDCQELPLDPSGRLILPLSERAIFGDGKVIITREGNSLLFLKEEEFLMQAMERLTGLKGLEYRRKLREISSFGFKADIDKNGRVVIPHSLRP